MEPRLQAVLERWDCRNPRPLKGDAGNRQYLRVDHPQLGTAVIVLYAAPDPSKPDDAYFDYRALQAYLDPVVRVATTIQYDDEDRAMLVGRRSHSGQTAMARHQFGMFELSRLFPLS